MNLVTSWHWLLWSCVSVSLGWSSCNYVVQLETGIAWSTGVCIPFGSSPGGLLPYIKFSCPTSTDKDQGFIYSELYTSSSCEATSFISRKLLNSTITPYDFKCDGVDGCHVSYIQGCAATSRFDQQVVMSPIDTCVVVNRRKENDRVFSYKFTCTNSQMAYQKFSNDNCDPSNLDSSDVVSECMDLPNARQWQFTQCQSAGQVQPKETNGNPTTTTAADILGRSYLSVEKQNEEFSQNSSGVKEIGIAFFYWYGLLFSLLLASFSI